MPEELNRDGLKPGQIVDYETMARIERSRKPVVSTDKPKAETKPQKQQKPGKFAE